MYIITCGMLKKCKEAFTISSANVTQQAYNAIGIHFEDVFLFVK